MIEDSKENPIIQFCRDIIQGVGGLHDYERYELAVPNFDRDICVAIFVIKCLANPKCDGSQEILNLILERRKELEAHDPNSGHERESD